MKSVLITAAISLLIGLGLGSQLFPKVESKTVEVQTERVVKDVVTVIKVITRPDGSKEEVTTTTDKSKEAKNSKSSAIVAAKADWHVSISAAKTLTEPEISYTIMAEKRVLGNIFVGVSANTNKQIGVSVGLEF